MIPKQDANLMAIMANARQYCMQEKTYYVDSRLLLLMILLLPDFSIPVDAPEKQDLIRRLTATAWDKHAFNGQSVPLTMEAEEIIEAGAVLQTLMGHKDLKAEHVLLALLSVSGICREEMERIGFIFEDYRKYLKHKWQQEVILSISSVAKMPERTPVEKKILGWFYGGTSKKDKLKRYLGTAQYYLKFNHFELAKVYGRKALELDVKNADAHDLCGIAYMKERSFPEALPHFEKIAILYPNDSYVSQRIASCVSETGDNIRAERLFKQLLAQQPDSPIILNNIGFFYGVTGRYEEAITHLDNAIALAPNAPFPHNNKGYALMQLGQLDAAKEHILKSLTLHKGNSYAYRNLALLHLKENNQPAAKEALLQAKRFRFTAMYGPEVEELLAGMEQH